MTWLLRLVAIWKTVTSAVTATHSQGRAFPSFQGVSSALITGAFGSVATAWATGAGDRGDAGRLAQRRHAAHRQGRRQHRLTQLGHLATRQPEAPTERRHGR